MLLKASQVRQIILQTAAVVGAAVVFLLLVDLILYSIATTSGWRLDPSTWGTYAAWASAILPTLGIVLTASMWMASRQNGLMVEAELSASKVQFEKAVGAVPSLRNNANDTLVIVGVEPEIDEYNGRILKKGSQRVTLDKNTQAVSFLMRGFKFRLDIDGHLAIIAESD